MSWPLRSTRCAGCGDWNTQKDRPCPCGYDEGLPEPRSWEERQRIRSARAEMHAWHARTRRASFVVRALPGEHEKLDAFMRPALRMRPRVPRGVWSGG